MKRHSDTVWLWALGWAALIFATSCSFIERSVFINFVKRFIPAGMPQQLWVDFWSYCGLIVVKGYHVTEYTILCFLLNRVLRGRIGKSDDRAIGLSAALCLVFAASDEWHQTFVPGRGGTWVDVVIDSIGITIATVSVLRRAKARKRVSNDLTLTQ